ncbi:MAG: bifunctional hydroxymethylpyrimidine kinase/phosphomethylpyrimidine kinase [Candidatus Thorarchaeota archaeon]
MKESKKLNRYIVIYPTNIMKPICLTIAGADPTSGAGIQADIRTFDRCGVHPFSVITAITYQTATEFLGYKSLSDELDQQLEVILGTYPVKNVKIGMIPDVKALDIIVEKIKKYNLKVVLDPIYYASAGERLSIEGLELEIERNLFPYVRVITPNLSEASYYSDRVLSKIFDEKFDQVEEVAEILLNKLYSNQYSKTIEKAVVIKSIETEQDDIYDIVLLNQIIKGKLQSEFLSFKKKRFDLEGNIHGTGCVFSSAITAYLAKDYSLKEAIVKAEKFFDSRFSSYIELPRNGKLFDLSFSDEEIKVIEQIKEIYNFISQSKEFSKLIPEVRMNISGTLPNAMSLQEIAGIEGRITIINGFPKASGEIKFGVSDHTARLILSAKKYDKSINFVMNLKYNPNWVSIIQEKSNLEIKEILRESQPMQIKKKEYTTMQWLIKESLNKNGKIPDIIWDKGSIGKEPMMRLFGKNSRDIILKLKKISDLIF